MNHRGTVRGYPVIKIVMALHLFGNDGLAMPTTSASTNASTTTEDTSQPVPRTTNSTITTAAGSTSPGQTTQSVVTNATSSAGNSSTPTKSTVGNDGLTVPKTSTLTTASTTTEDTSQPVSRTTKSTIATTAGATSPGQATQSVVTDATSSAGKSSAPTKSTKTPDEGATAGQDFGGEEKSLNVGAVVGGTVAAAVILVIGVAVVVWYRKKGCPMFTASPSRHNNAGSGTDDSEGTMPEGRVYQELSVSPEYANTGMDQPYDTMQQTALTSQSKETQMEDQGTYENINPPVYWNTEGAVYEAVKPPT